MAVSRPASTTSQPETASTVSRSSSPSASEDGKTHPGPENKAESSSRSPSETPLNGDQTVTTTAQKKPGLSSGLSYKLTRMFSGKGAEAVNVSPEALKDRKASSTSVSSIPAGMIDSSNRPLPSRGRSSSNTMKAQMNSAPVQTPDKKGDMAPPAMPSRRFNMHQDGTHDHHLKSEKRQEKLGDMFKNMLMGKKKDGEHHDHQLSLMSSWVEQVKNEKVASDEKGGPNCADTLVEKYGKCHEVVGRGAFGIVRISHKADQKDPRKEQLYAIKEFRRRPSESPKKYNKRLTSEFCISSALRHPNVIHTLDLMKDAKGDFCEVMEFCAGGDLYSLVLAAGKLEVVEADCYFKQLMRGVEYIHEMGVSHRDLKPENLLLTTHGSLKITDFGNGECFRMAWEQEPHMVAGLCGSAPYISPEEYVNTEFDPRAVDVWACGVIYMAMRTGRHLWRVARKDEDEFYERYLEGRRDEDGYGPIETLHRVSHSSYTIPFRWISPY